MPTGYIAGMVEAEPVIEKSRAARGNGCRGYVGSLEKHGRGGFLEGGAAHS